MKEYGLDTSIYMRMEYQSTKLCRRSIGIYDQNYPTQKGAQINCFKSVGTKIVEQACQKLASYCVPLILGTFMRAALEAFPHF